MVERIIIYTCAGLVVVAVIVAVYYYKLARKYRNQLDNERHGSVEIAKKYIEMEKLLKICSTVNQSLQYKLDKALQKVQQK